MESMLANLDVDARQPEVFFKVPFVDNATIGVASPDPLFWVCFSAAGLFDILMQMVTGIFVYYLIVKKRGTATAYLVGYGVIIPFLLYLPFAILPMLPTSNAFVALAIGVVVTVCFRVAASIHGTALESTETDLASTMLYYGAAIPFRIDGKTGKPIAVTQDELLEKFLSLLSLYLQGTVVFNLMGMCDYELFFMKKPVENVFDLFYWGNLMNNYFMAALTSLVLMVPATSLALPLSQVTGYSMAPFNHSPLTASESVTDFWSRRWNRVTSGLLKIGTYKPMLKNGYSKTVATLATFIASGILHEYALYVVAARRPNDVERRSGVFVGVQWMFFLWNGIIMMVELQIGGHPVFAWMKQNLPKPIRVALAIMLALPLAHLFTDDFQRLGIIDALYLGFPKFFWNPTTLE